MGALIGYFVDNELSWGGMRSERARYGLALGALAEGADSAAKHAFIERLKALWGAVGSGGASERSLGRAHRIVGRTAGEALSAGGRIHAGHEGRFRGVRHRIRQALFPHRPRHGEGGREIACANRCDKNSPAADRRAPSPRSTISCSTGIRDPGPSDPGLQMLQKPKVIVCH
jgi:hypothetical protein